MAEEPKELTRQPLSLQALFLTLEYHAGEVINLLGKNANDYSILCVDVVHQSSGDKVGEGPTVLYIARIRENHFVPLLPVP